MRTSTNPDSIEHDIDSPFWNCTITAIEIFYSNEDANNDSIHGLIEKESDSSEQWLLYTEGNTRYYTTDEVIDMISNDPNPRPSSTRRMIRYRPSRRTNTEVVYSVRLKYNKVQFFVDRDKGRWHHWSKDAFALSTAQIKDILLFV